MTKIYLSVLFAMLPLAAVAKDQTVTCPDAVNAARAECKARCQASNMGKNKSKNIDLAQIKKDNAEAEIKKADAVINNPSAKKADKDAAEKAKKKALEKIAEAEDLLDGCSSGTQNCGALEGKIASCLSGKKKKITFKVLHPNATFEEPKKEETTEDGGDTTPTTSTATCSAPTCTSVDGFTCMKVFCPTEAPAGCATDEQRRNNSTNFASAMGECGRRCRDVSNGGADCIDGEGNSMNKCGSLGEKLQACKNNQISDFELLLSSDDKVVPQEKW